MAIGFPSMEKESFLIFLEKDLLKTITFVLSGLTFKPHSLQYASSVERQFFRPFSVSERRTKSSANDREFISQLFISSDLQFFSKMLCMSLIKMLKSNGLRLQPCLTPSLLAIGMEKLPPDLII